jgi:hypothetical protein
MGMFAIHSLYTAKYLLSPLRTTDLPSKLPGIMKRRYILLLSKYLGICIPKSPEKNFFVVYLLNIGEGRIKQIRICNNLTTNYMILYIYF